MYFSAFTFLLSPSSMKSKYILYHIIALNIIIVECDSKDEKPPFLFFLTKKKKLSRIDMGVEISRRD
jgi:hypothetical protein